jgi:hypothetical protein
LTLPPCDCILSYLYKKVKPFFKKSFKKIGVDFFAPVCYTNNVKRRQRQKGKGWKMLEMVLLGAVAMAWVAALVKMA